MGTWKTTDGGNSWTFFRTEPFNVMAFDPRGANGWMSLVHVGQGRADYYRTTDAARNWMQCGQATRSSPVAVQLLGDGIGFGHTIKDGVGQLLRTSDGGCKWDSVQTRFDFSGDRFNGLFFLNSQEGWVTGVYTPKLFHTRDGGVRWDEIPLTVGPGPGARAVSVYFSTSRTGWIIASLPDFYGVLRTIDGGQRWEKMTAADVGAAKLPEDWRDGKLFQMLARANRR